MPVDQFTEKADAAAALLEKASKEAFTLSLCSWTEDFLCRRYKLAQQATCVFCDTCGETLNSQKSYSGASQEHRCLRFTLHFRRGRKGCTLQPCSLPCAKEHFKNRSKNKELSLEDLYFVFAANLPKSVGESVFYILQGYRRCWGIEAGYRVMGMVKAKTMSKNYVLRFTYRLAAVFVCNVW
jgi:hypothetical protein